MTNTNREDTTMTTSEALTGQNLYRALLTLTERELHSNLRHRTVGEPALDYTIYTDKRTGDVTASAAQGAVTATVTVPSTLNRLNHLHTCDVSYTQEASYTDLSTGEARIAARLINAAANAADACAAASREYCAN
jgi:hypothetical protein